MFRPIILGLAAAATIVAVTMAAAVIGTAAATYAISRATVTVTTMTPATPRWPDRYVGRFVAVGEPTIILIAAFHCHAALTWADTSTSTTTQTCQRHHDGQARCAFCVTIIRVTPRGTGGACSNRRGEAHPVSSCPERKFLPIYGRWRARIPPSIKSLAGIASNGNTDAARVSRLHRAARSAVGASHRRHTLPRTAKARSASSSGTSLQVATSRWRRRSSTRRPCDMRTPTRIDLGSAIANSG